MWTQTSDQQLKTA